MNPIVGAIQAGLVGANTIPKPRFILEIPNFRIRDVANDPAVATELDNVGFGIISYTWGRFQDKKTYETSLNAPKFDLINVPGPNQIWWYIPKLLPGNFSIDDVRGIVQSMNMKYVWWDWACIPQSWDSNDTPDPWRPTITIGSLSDRGKAIANEEVAKQFYIYTLAKKGVIWLRDIEWANPVQTSLKQLLLKEQRGQTTQNLGAAVAQARTAVETFQLIKTEDSWLSSMWTFQEGVLLNSDDVIDPRDDRLLALRKPSQFARLVDKTGHTLKADTCFRGEATLLDITGRATLLACDMAGLVIQAIQSGQMQVANEVQTLLSRLYETGMVGVAADSPLDILEAAKARGVTTMSEVDYCVNALLGALRVVLPPGTPDGRDDDDERQERRLAFLSALVERNGWKMILLTKPTRGAWDPNRPADPTAGKGDWLSILQRTWQFTSLGVFITSRVGRRQPRPNTLTPSVPSITADDDSSTSTPSGVGHIIPSHLSLTTPIPYTDNVLLLGALQVRDHISLPPLRHALSVQAQHGLQPTRSDALVIGPEDPDAVMFGNPPPYGAFFYSGATSTGGIISPATGRPVPAGPVWASCRFYASEAEPAPANPGIYPIKTAHALVKRVDYVTAFREETFGAGVCVVLLPVEDVSVYKGSIGGKGGMERVVVLRCVVLTDFRMGPAKGAKGMVGGGIFLGVGDFTFKGSPVASTVASVLGDEWMIYMY